MSVQRRDFMTGMIGAAAVTMAPSLASAATPGQATSGEEATTSKSLAAQVALVTGGARGIGRATALALAGEGAHIVIVDIAKPDAMPTLPYPLGSTEDLAETERLVRAQGVRALSIVADVRDFAAMQAAMQKAVETFGRLDIVHANAGINVGKDSLDDYDPDMFNLAMSVNAFGVANTIKAAEPHLTSPGGRIIVTTSLEARTGYGNVAYGVSKWAAQGLMKNAAANLGKKGISVNAVAPGSTQTVLAYHLYGGEITAEATDARNKIVRENATLPLDQFQPEDIARCVLFLAGPAGATLTGTTIDINGGRTVANVV